MEKNLMTWRTAKHILCVRLDNMGDVLMTSPAFRALKRFNPDAHLTLLTSSMGAGIARMIPELDDVLVFDAPWMKLDAATPDSEAVLGLIERLKGFDAAIIFTVFSQNPMPAMMLCYLAGIPLRLAHCRENPYHLLTDWVPDTEPFTEIVHEVTRQLNLVRTIGAETEDDRLSLHVPPESCERALTKVRAAGIDLSQAWVLVHPGVSEAKRQYPPAGYIEVVRALTGQGIQVVVTGGHSERALTEEIAGAGGGVSMAGQFALDEFAGLVASAPLLIANNTGPVHIAAAVGTPVVVLYAYTNPQHTPWKVPNRVLYFDVPETMRSRNPLLAYSYAQIEKVPDATPGEIVSAVHELMQRDAKTQRNTRGS